MNGKQLKNSILQWAIQGKLVPQDPNDEPASVLLECIRAERMRLFKEGKIKKDKNESIIYRGDDNSYYEKFADGRVVCIDDEIPFEIPQSWEWARLKNMFSLQAGKNITSSEIKSSVDDLFKYPCFGGNGLRGYVRRYNNKGIKPLIGRQGALCGNLNMSYGQFYATEHAVVVDSFGDEINVDWSYYFLTALNLNQYATATAQPGLAVSKIIECLIPVPPRSEQIRIVAKIRLLIPCLDRFQYAQDKLETLNEDINNRLKKSILQEAIQGHLVAQDSNDEPVSLLLDRIRIEKQKMLTEGKLKQKDVHDSVIFKGEDNKYYEAIAGVEVEIELPYVFPESWAAVRLQSICALLDGEKKTGNGICLDAKFLRGKSSGDYLQSGKYVNKGDNIILVDGENSGEVFSVPIDGYMGSTFKQLWISHSLYEPYVLECIRFYKDELRNSKKGAAIPHLNKDVFKNLVIGIPPINEQHRIVERLNELNTNL